jgi:hypothetical protein
VLFTPALAGGLAALALAAPTAVPPPSQPGTWTQLGAAVTSRPGAAVHFYRIALGPKALGVVVRTSSSRPIKLVWSSYCEVFDDDAEMNANQGTVTGTKQVVVYPPVLAMSTRCYVWVNAKVGGKARLVAAEFASSS